VAEVIVTSSDGIQFRVLLHARTDAQLNYAIKNELRFAAARTAEQLASFNGDFVRIDSLDDVCVEIAPEDTLFAGAVHNARVGPLLTVIDGGGISSVLSPRPDLKLIPGGKS
jgi:hypothetical protein